MTFSSHNAPRHCIPDIPMALGVLTMATLNADEDDKWELCGVTGYSGSSITLCIKPTGSTDGKYIVEATHSERIRFELNAYSISLGGKYSKLPTNFRNIPCSELPKSHDTARISLHSLQETIMAEIAGMEAAEKLRLVGILFRSIGCAANG